MSRRAGITRERAVAVAAELADKQGLEEVTLAAVAEQLGIRLPSLYNHIAGQAGLRRELAACGLRQLREQISRAALGRAGDDALMAIAQAMRRYSTDHPGLYAATIVAPAPDDHELQEIGQAILDVLYLVLGHYGLDQPEATHAIRGLRSITHGFATLEAAGGFGLPLDRDESFVRLLRAYIAGLHQQPQSRRANPGKSAESSKQAL